MNTTRQKIIWLLQHAELTVHQLAQSCGWHFAADNAAIHTHGKMTRTEPRTQINFKKFGVTIIRCSDCFERELFSTRAHSKSGTDGEGLYRNAIS